MYAKTSRDKMNNAIIMILYFFKKANGLKQQGKAEKQTQE